MREKLKAAALFVVSLADLRDLVTIAGLGCIGYGLSLVYVPAAWVVVGCLLFWLAVGRRTNGVA